MDHQSIPKYFRISSEETPYASVVRVAGEVDMLSAPSLRECLMKLIVEKRPPAIIVDFQGVSYLDMRGVRVLEDCHRRAERDGLRLILVGSAPLVHRVLAIVKLDERITLVDTMGEALKALGQA